MVWWRWEREEPPEAYPVFVLGDGPRMEKKIFEASLFCVLDRRMDGSIDRLAGFFFFFLVMGFVGWTIGGGGGLVLEVWLAERG